ncbi:MAG: hydrogenase maturation protease [Proteobacteria bacterium]|nr:hydrogenase maturation protease [Pseudomonadota bacterium]
MSIPHIASILKRRLTGKVVVAGVGNRECKDDGAGVSLVSKLISSRYLKPISVGASPEFHLSEIIAEHPDVVMFVDTVELCSPPGSVAVLEKGQLPTGWGNTHQPPLSIIMKYVSEQTGADTFLLGIQPEDVSAGKHMSSSGAGTVKVISDFLNGMVTRNEKTLRGEKI